MVNEIYRFHIPKYLRKTTTTIVVSITPHDYNKNNESKEERKYKTKEKIYKKRNGVELSLVQPQIP